VKFKFLLTAVICLFVAGCLTAPDEPNILLNGAADDYELVLAKTKLMPDPHAGWVKVVGPAVHYDNDFFSENKYIIQSWIDPKRQQVDDTFQIQAKAGFPKRVFLKQAYAEGRELDTVVIDRERVDCGYDCTTVETIGINLTENDMARCAQMGMSFEVIGRRESIVITIPAQYFAAVLEFHRRHRPRT
jgi:hypothetical protein